eukprot:TRINITY_DN20320_c0_g1_i1.p1 TRINITY_DN20320_c0_g1~~TRINITY_DN20320_c0_g1_i1.p1  ORF type:complete len:664 (+),score=151.53 TRINITY_DN20320_c0_g1_i1:97-2088(+)
MGDSAEAELKELRQRNHQLQDTVSDLEKRLAEVQIEATKHSKLVAPLQDDLELVRKRLAESNKAREDLVISCQNLERELEELHIMYAAEQQVVHQMRDSEEERARRRSDDEQVRALQHKCLYLCESIEELQRENEILRASPIASNWLLVLRKSRELQGRCDRLVTELAQWRGAARSGEVFTWPSCMRRNQRLEIKNSELRARLVAMKASAVGGRGSGDDDHIGASSLIQLKSPPKSPTQRRLSMRKMSLTSVIETDSTPSSTKPLENVLDFGVGKKRMIDHDTLAQVSMRSCTSRLWLAKNVAKAVDIPTACEFVKENGDLVYRPLSAQSISNQEKQCALGAFLAAALVDGEAKLRDTYHAWYSLTKSNRRLMSTMLADKMVVMQGVSRRQVFAEWRSVVMDSWRQKQNQVAKEAKKQVQALAIKAVRAMMNPDPETVRKSAFLSWAKLVQQANEEMMPVTAMHSSSLAIEKRATRIHHERTAELGSPQAWVELMATVEELQAQHRRMKAGFRYMREFEVEARHLADERSKLLGIIADLQRENGLLRTQAANFAGDGASATAAGEEHAASRAVAALSAVGRALGGRTAANLLAAAPPGAQDGVAAAYPGIDPLSAAPLAGARFEDKGSVAITRDGNVTSAHVMASVDGLQQHLQERYERACRP